MFNSQTDEIKSRLDIVSVISQYLRLSKSGVNYRALCPFHSEKNPSFFVSPTRQIWHCFSCGKGGDIFKFVMEIEGVDFREALEKLAQKAGVILKRENLALKSERKKLHEILETAAKFFEQNLKNQKEILDYLKSRGLQQETIEEFRLGYSSESAAQIFNFLKEKEYSIQDIEKTGLIIKGERGYYDRFRDRIMFPIFDLSGNVVGFGGRIFKEKEGQDLAKYINSPNTLLYDKSRILYGLNKAQLEIRKQDFCILVEGYMDLIMSHQAGVKNVVAASGTALSEHQLNLISRYTNNLYMSFDMDSAGEAATKRTIDLAQNSGFNVKIILLPYGKDPADLVKENPDLWQKAISDARPIMEFYFENAFSKYNPEVLEEKKQLVKELLGQIKKIQNKIEVAHWLKKLSEKLNINENFLEEELDKIVLGDSEYDSDHLITSNSLVYPIGKTPIQSLAERLLIFLFKYPKYIFHLNDFKQDYFRKNSLDFKIISSSGQEFNFLELIEKIFYCFDTENLNKEVCQELFKNNSLIEIVKNKTDSQIFEFLDNLLFKEECLEISAIDEKDIEKEIIFCKREIQIKLIRDKLSVLNLKLKNESNLENQIDVLTTIHSLTQILNKIMKT